MLNNTNISNIILLTDVFADDLWSSSIILIIKMTLDKLILCFIAEECWTSPVFFCTDVIYSSFSLRFIHYTFCVKDFYIRYKYNFLY